jgi:hypothetical protein
MTRNHVVLATVCIVGWTLLSLPTASRAQQRYTPSRPTVSPYLNLFQNNRNGGPVSRALPNYYSLVRPQLQQNRINNNQQQLIQQQNTVIDQLQQNVQVLQQQPGNVVTGHNSWFLNTSRYYAQAGSAGVGQQPGRAVSAGSAAQFSRPASSTARRR